jgi:hypothetical protein
MVFIFFLVVARACSSLLPVSPSFQYASPVSKAR